MRKIFAGSILAVLALVFVTLAARPAHAQFSYALCYVNAAEYERVYIQTRGDIYKQPLLVCYWTQAQTQALRAQLKAKYGY